MYVMTSKDKLLLDDYKSLGTPEEIRARLSNPYPQEDEGYAPCPWANNFEGDGRPDSGLLTDDGEDANYAVCVVCGSEIPEGYQVCCTCEKNSLLNLGVVPFEDDDCAIVQDDWADK